jgi:hypothetical protein
MAKIQADIVLTYPNEDGDWETLKLSKFSAEYVHSSLAFALEKLNEPWAAPKVRSGNGDDPAAYAS